MLRLEQRQANSRLSASHKLSTGSFVSDSEYSSSGKSRVFSRPHFRNLSNVLVVGSVACIPSLRRRNPLLRMELPILCNVILIMKDQIRRRQLLRTSEGARPMFDGHERGQELDRLSQA